MKTREIIFLLVLAVLLLFVSSCGPGDVPGATVSVSGTPVAGITTVAQPVGTPQATPVPQQAAAQVVTAKAETADSVPLVYAKYDPAVKQNVQAALGANNGKLRSATIVEAGQAWSFGNQLGDINVLLPQLASANGVLGGGWGDLAARYLSAWDGLGLPAQFAPSVNQMVDVPAARAPAIYLGEPEGNSDLVLVNASSLPVELTVVETDSQLVVHARVLHPKG